jgi:hypothetical protein
MRQEFKDCLNLYSPPGENLDAAELSADEAIKTDSFIKIFVDLSS